MLTRWLPSLFALILALSAALSGVQSGAMAAMAAAGEGSGAAGQVTELVICTSEGRQIIRIDETGKELPTPEKHPCCKLTCGDCSLCPSSAAIVPSETACLPLPARSSILPASLALSHASARRLARARAPPRTFS